MLENFDQLESWFEQTLGDATGTDAAREHALQQFQSRLQIRTLLTSILSDEYRLERIANQSYRHPNRFDKLILFDSVNTGLKLRMHIWWPQINVPSGEHIHNHAWDFSSLILTGSYRFEVFNMSDSGQEMYSYKPAPLHSGEPGHRLTPQGPRSLTRVFSGTLRSGCIYSISNLMLHRVINAGNQLTSTLLVQGKKIVGRWPDVLNESPIEDGSEMRILPFAAGELSRIISEYLKSSELTA